MDTASDITYKRSDLFIVQLQCGVALGIAAAITNKHCNFYIYYTSRIWNPRHCHWGMNTSIAGHIPGRVHQQEIYYYGYRSHYNKQV